jgi:methionine synthase I (cobalamin-dependent)
MTNALSKLLKTRDWLLADGATGTNLFNMGLESGDAPEMWNDEHPDRITRLYTMAVDAGSDIFLTNSFGGNAARLKLHGAEKRARELSPIVMCPTAYRIKRTERQLQNLVSVSFETLFSRGLIVEDSLSLNI